MLFITLSELKNFRVFFLKFSTFLPDCFRERDELVTELTGLRARYGDLKMREEDAYQQVKRSVEMVEQAQLEQTQVREGEG